MRRALLVIELFIFSCWAATAATFYCYCNSQFDAFVAGLMTLLAVRSLGEFVRLLLDKGKV
jgi:hypothetical protein